MGVEELTLKCEKVYYKLHYIFLRIVQFSIVLYKTSWVCKIQKDEGILELLLY